MFWLLGSAYLSLLKKIWGDPVWSKVIAAAILGTAAIATAYLKGWRPSFTTLVRDAISFALAKSPVPNWLLALFILCSLGLLFLFGIAFWPSSGKAPFRVSFREGNFFHIRWRWSYGPDGDIDRLSAFCPVCDLQIHPQYVNSYREPDRVEYRCEDCRALLHEFNIPQEDVESLIIRHIHKNIRTGRWKAQNG